MKEAVNLSPDIILNTMSVSGNNVCTGNGRKHDYFFFLKAWRQGSCEVKKYMLITSFRKLLEHLICKENGRRGGMKEWSFREPIRDYQRNTTIDSIKGCQGVSTIRKDTGCQHGIME